MRRVCFTHFVMFLGLTAPALAHDTWIAPTTFTSPPGVVVRLDLTSGMAFPRPETPVKLPRVAGASWRLGGEAGDILDRQMSDSSQVLRHVFSRAGVATIRVDLHPREIELSDKNVAEYFEEIHAGADIRSAWAGLAGRVPWKETYTKHAKTFVLIGEGPGDDSWKVGVGAPVELVPGASPCQAVVGRVMPVTLLMNAEPLAGQPVGLLVEGDSTRVFHETDAAGRATFALTRPGRVMLFTVRLRLDRATMTWTSDFCTLTFDIREAAAPPAEAIPAGDRRAN